MASVTFPIAFGGDGSTITDDASATTGLANGGHRTRYVPSLAQAVAVMGYCVNQATTQAGNAATSATAAAASAASALAAPGTNATSATSLTIALGAQSLTVQANKNIVPGMAVMLANTANPAGQFMHGIVTAYTSATGALAVSADYVFGSGTVATWTVSTSAPLDSTRAPLASPALTGTPTTTLAPVGDNSAQIASTAWVKANPAVGAALTLSNNYGGF